MNAQVSHRIPAREWAPPPDLSDGAPPVHPATVGGLPPPGPYVGPSSAHNVGPATVADGRAVRGANAVFSYAPPPQPGAVADDNAARAGALAPVGALAAMAAAEADAAAVVAAAAEEDLADAKTRAEVARLRCVATDLVESVRRHDSWTTRSRLHLHLHLHIRISHS